MQYKGLHDQ